MGAHSFRRISGKLPETLWRLCISEAFPHQEIQLILEFFWPVTRKSSKVVEWRRSLKKLNCWLKRYKLIKNRLRHNYFSVRFAKFIITYFVEHLRTTVSKSIKSIHLKLYGLEDIKMKILWKCTVSPETLRRLRISKKFPHHEFRWYLGILCNVLYYFANWKIESCAETRVISLQ